MAGEAVHTAGARLGAGVPGGWAAFHAGSSQSCVGEVTHQCTSRGCRAGAALHSSAPGDMWPPGGMLLRPLAREQSRVGMCS